MLQFVSGDFFDYDADIRVNTVNCVGVMGAGVALMFKKKYPVMFREYLHACKRNEVAPGKPYVWEKRDFFSNITIINFPTKVHWKNPSEYEYIEKGLVWLRNFLLNRKSSTVTLPALGCGHGGLDWEKVKVMIKEYLGDLDTKILVFEPSSSTHIFKDNSYEMKLKNKDIDILLPNDKFYPSKLEGRSALKIYYKGNINLMENKNIALVTNSKVTEKEKNSLLRLINELPNDKFVFLLGLSNSYEIDIAKEVLERGFKAIFIIPFGILQLRIRRDLKELWNYENIVVLSTLDPNQAWKSYQSVNALKLRFKIADIAIINSLNYNYFIRYEKEMKQANNKIFYINYWNEDVTFFKDLAAKKIGISAEFNKPNVSSLLLSLNEISK